MKAFLRDSRKVVLIVYKVILPLVMAVFLFLFSSSIPRPKFLGSDFTDFLARILLWIWFFIGYWRLPTLYDNIANQKFRLRIEFSSKLLAKIYYFSNAIGFSLMMFLFTWWTIEYFVPLIKSFSIIIGILNGLFFAIPQIFKYDEFKSIVNQ